MVSETHFQRLETLVRGALAPPPGGRPDRFGADLWRCCAPRFRGGRHGDGPGDVFRYEPQPGKRLLGRMHIVVNAFLVLQFPLVHSLLLTGPGMRLLVRVVPGRHAQTLGTTTYALVASLQLLALFALWTPSGVVWWRAEGVALYAVNAAYATAWGLLIKASWDAGAEVQSGALGWMSLMRNATPEFPDMPTGGLFRIIRQPIYVAFALTLWTVPTWTPDQLALAFGLTALLPCSPQAERTTVRGALWQSVPQLQTPSALRAPGNWKKGKT